MNFLEFELVEVIIVLLLAFFFGNSCLTAEPLVESSSQASSAKVAFTNRSFERKPKWDTLLDSSLTVMA